MGTTPGRDHLPELPRARAEHHPGSSCSALQQDLAEGLWGLGLNPCAGQRVEDGRGAQSRWQGAGAGREEVGQGQAVRKGSYHPIYCSLLFCLPTPIKAKPGFDSSHLGGSVHPGELSPSPSPPLHHHQPQQSSFAGTVTSPRPASLPRWHRLAPASLRSFSRSRDTLWGLFL